MSFCAAQNIWAPLYLYEIYFQKLYTYNSYWFFFSDRDLEKLYEQWEEDDEPLPVDELPEWDPRKPRPSLDLSDMSKFGEPEDFLKASKKGQSVMMFVRVSGSPTR